MSSDDSPSILQPDHINLGTVPYLNVQPMIWALEKGLVGKPGQVSLHPAVPRKLATSLAAGAYDAAIVPVFEYFAHPDQYSYLSAPVIATQDAVLSVVLYSSCPWAQVKRVYLDSSSYTSVHLFKVLAAENGIKPEYLDTTSHEVPVSLPPETGWVVIGDPAIAEIGKHPYTLDLGVAWKELTGLPFVFAAWLVPAEVKKNGMADLLNASLTAALANLEQVAADSAERFNVTPEFALRYFKQYIHYNFGDEELAGWKEFGRLCHKHHLIRKIPEFRQYQES